MAQRRRPAPAQPKQPVVLVAMVELEATLAAMAVMVAIALLMEIITAPRLEVLAAMVVMAHRLAVLEGHVGLQLR